MDLLDSVEAKFKLVTGEPVGLRQFMAVSRDRLKDLTESKLKKLCQSDGLELIYAHIHSMSNFRKLCEQSSIKSEYLQGDESSKTLEETLDPSAS